VSALAPVILALDMIRPDADSGAPAVAAAFWTAVGCAVLAVAAAHGAPLWYLGQCAAGSLILVVNAALDTDLQVGLAYSGLTLTGTVTLWCLTAAVGAHRFKAGILAATLLAVLLITIVYVPFHSRLLLSLPAPGPWWLKMVRQHFQLALFAALLVPLYLFCRHTSLPVRPLQRDVHGAAVLLLAVILAVVARQVPWSPGQAAGVASKIVFFDEGQLDWEVPVFGRYGGRRGGMFGVLHQYLRARGHAVAIAGITPEALVDAHTLVLINLHRTLTAAEHDRVWSFVDRGGSLLILGDHTGREHIRIPCNHLLTPVNIRFNYDSALSLTPKWVDALAIRPHPITRHGRDENDLQIWIGASLSIAYPARPIVIGRHAFSDGGNDNAATRGFLGDMHYTPGERLGDIVLVAESRYGRGKVLVFGDTSSFQNSTLVLSAPFVDDVFDWLGPGGWQGIYPHDCLILAIMVLGAAAWVAAGTGMSRRRAPLLVAAGALVGMSLSLADTHHRIPVDRVDTRLAYIDRSHLARFDLDLWGEDNGFGGLAYNLIRNGYLPQALKTLDTRRLQQTGLLVLIAPAQPVSPMDIAAIDGWVQQGGRLLLTVGWEEKDACQALMDRFGLAIRNTPLGRGPPARNDTGARFVKAWPVTATGDHVRTLIRVWDFAVAVCKGHGKGSVLLVGDSAFLLNHNLEGLHHHVEANIHALRKLLDAVAEPS
jgi:hypothetical protein